MYFLQFFSKINFCIIFLRSCEVLFCHANGYTLVLVCIMQRNPLGQIRRCVNCVMCVIIDRLYLGIVDFPWSFGLSETYGVLAVICHHHFLK